MKKKICVPVLALLLFISMLPIHSPAHAAIEAPLRDIVTQLYDTFSASVYQPNASDDAIDQLLKPALYGNGESMQFGQKDTVTAAIYGSNVFRSLFIDAVSAGITTMQTRYSTALMTGGQLNWYDFKYSYIVRQYGDLDPNNPNSAVLSTSRDTTGQPSISGNGCDSALSLIVGGAQCRILLEQTEATMEGITYGIQVYVTDTFDFDGSYSAFDKKGYNTTFSKLLTLLGPLLGLKTFDWCSTTEMTVTVPNICEHNSGGTYRWDKRDGELTDTTGSGLRVNPIQRIVQTSTDKETGVTTESKYYKLERPVFLLHSAPWYIEFRTRATSVLYLGPNETHGVTRNPTFIKGNTRINAMLVDKSPKINPATGQEELLTRREYWGFDFTEAGTVGSEYYTFRIENRVNADGTNVLWLWLDGTELGPMDDYQNYWDALALRESLGKDAQWFTGKDFIIQYIHNRSFSYGKEMLVEYLEICTGTDYLTTEQTPASCAAGSKTTVRCVLCGQTVSETVGTPLAHSPELLPGKDASCLEPGLTEGSRCSVCGEIIQRQEPIPVTAHTPTTVSPEIPPACTASGSTEAAVCADCGTVLKEAAPIPATGHRYEEGICTYCGETDPDHFIPGDVNGDTKADYSDALLILRASIGLETLTEKQMRIADVTNDGKPDYSDALKILRASIGLETLG